MSADRLAVPDILSDTVSGRPTGVAGRANPPDEDYRRSVGKTTTLSCPFAPTDATP